MDSSISRWRSTSFMDTAHTRFALQVVPAPLLPLAASLLPVSYNVRSGREGTSRVLLPAHKGGTGQRHDPDYDEDGGS